MDNQEAFDKMARHLIKQGEQSLEEEGDICMYRSESQGETLSCAVGCLIPDDVYRHDMEYRNVAEVLREYPKLRDLFSGVHPRLFKLMQKIHDDTNPHQWPEKLREEAAAWNLTTSALDEAIAEYGEPK